MLRLRKDLIEYRVWRKTSQKHRTKFGDWTSVSRLIKRAADELQPGSADARRLNELSQCRDSKSPAPLNLGKVHTIIRNVFGIIQEEFFKDLPPAENLDYWNSYTCENFNQIQHQAEQEDDIPMIEQTDLSRNRGNNLVPYSDSRAPSPQFAGANQPLESAKPAICALESCKVGAFRGLKASPRLVSSGEATAAAQDRKDVPLHELLRRPSHPESIERNSTPFHEAHGDGNDCAFIDLCVPDTPPQPATRDLEVSPPTRTPAPSLAQIPGVLLAPPQLSLGVRTIDAARHGRGILERALSVNECSQSVGAFCRVRSGESARVTPFVKGTLSLQS